MAPTSHVSARGLSASPETLRIRVLVSPNVTVNFTPSRQREGAPHQNATSPKPPFRVIRDRGMTRPAGTLLRRTASGPQNHTRCLSRVRRAHLMRTLTARKPCRQRGHCPRRVGRPVDWFPVALEHESGLQKARHDDNGVVSACATITHFDGVPGPVLVPFTLATPGTRSSPLRCASDAHPGAAPLDA